MSDFVFTLDELGENEQNEQDEIEDEIEENIADLDFSAATQPELPPSVRKQTKLELRVEGVLSTKGKPLEEIDDDEEEEEEKREDGIKVPPPEKARKEKKKQNTEKKKQKTEKKKAKPSKPSVEFPDLKLSRPIMRAIKDLGWASPTPVQAQAIPIALTGSDLLVNAVTGSGKTAAFMLPVLERLQYRTARVFTTRVLVLTPTRELAAQCHQMTQDLSKYTDVRSVMVAGGLSLQVQEVSLRARPDIVIATPGRLIDHLRNTKSVHMEDVEILILDEADRLLELGFSDEVKEIVKACPKGRQTMLFSATLTETVNDLVNLSLNRPKRVSADPLMSIVSNLTQEFIRIRQNREEDREAHILALCKRTFTNQTIIFVQSKQLTHRMAIIFALAKLKAAELHGNLTQAQRLEALERFKKKQVDFLLCTDLAARGLDIDGVQTVLNMSLPKQFTQYVHRVGRTARAGRAGRAVSLVGEGQRKLLKEVMKKARDVVKSRVVPATVIEKYKNFIKSAESHIIGVLKEERLEKEARLAEMEANKAKNLIIHQKDIAMRPARTWFQTKLEKQAVKEKSETLFHEADEAKEQKEKEEMEEKKKKEKKHQKTIEEKLRGLPRKKRRRKLQAMADEKEREREEREKALEDGLPDPKKIRKRKRKKDEDEENNKPVLTDIQKQVLAAGRRAKAKRRGTDKGNNNKKDNSEIPPLPKYDNFEDENYHFEKEVAKQSTKGKKAKKNQDSLKGNRYAFDTSPLDSRFRPKKNTILKEKQAEEAKSHNPNKPSKRSFKSKGRYKRRK